MGRVTRVFVSPTIIGIIALVLLTAFTGQGGTHMVSTTATSTPSPTPGLPLTPSPTPFMLPGPTASQRCLPASDDTAPDGAIDVLVHLLNDEPLLDYFNDGGTVEMLRASLETSGNKVGPYRSQVIEHDVTGDAIPEIFVAITDAILSVDYGESHLIMFQCVDHAYQEMILFRRAGAGIRAEGLYTGGGAHILSIADLNDNGAIDLVFEVDWLDAYGEYAEYYMLEWQDDDFHAIVQYQNDLEDTLDYIRSDTIGDVALIDLGDDGLRELVVDGITYRWDGEFYTAIDE